MWIVLVFRFIFHTFWWLFCSFPQFSIRLLSFSSFSSIFSLICFLYFLNPCFLILPCSPHLLFVILPSLLSQIHLHFILISFLQIILISLHPSLIPWVLHLKQFLLHFSFLIRYFVIRLQYRSLLEFFLFLQWVLLVFWLFQGRFELRLFCKLFMTF